MVQYQVWKANRLISRTTCNVERDLLVLRVREDCDCGDTQVCGHFV